MKTTLHDLTGQRFGRLVVQRRGENKGKHVQWICQCDCGALKAIGASHLSSGATVSCGCYARDQNTKHGHCGRKAQAPEYNNWENMIQRCTNPNTPKWHLYGGKGITVCDRWKSFPAFLADMGPKPTPRHTIERRDGNGNYEPSNCYWATYKEQSNNTASNRLVTWQGETLNITQWSERLGFGRGVLDYRLDRGWSVERAMTTPSGVSRRRGSPCPQNQTAAFPFPVQ